MSDLSFLIINQIDGKMQQNLEKRIVQIKQVELQKQYSKVAKMIQNQQAKICIQQSKQIKLRKKLTSSVIPKKKIPKLLLHPTKSLTSECPQKNSQQKLTPSLQYQKCLQSAQKQIQLLIQNQSNVEENISQMFFGISKRIEDQIGRNKAISKGIDKVRYDTQKTHKSIAEVLQLVEIHNNHKIYKKQNYHPKV